MKLKNSERETLFLHAKNINSNLGTVFQNPLWLDINMIDNEIEELNNFELEIKSYRENLNKIKTRITDV